MWPLSTPTSPPGSSTWCCATTISVLHGLGCQDVRHYGIRGFCYYITDEARKYDPAFYAHLEQLELATTARPPYMHTARLFQLTARKRSS